MKKLVVILVVFVLVGFARIHAGDINVIMMESTCKIIGDGSVGTGFIVGKPHARDPKTLLNTLVTAAHVLEATKGDTLTIVLRKYDGTNGYKRLEVPIKIREAGRILWLKHTNADVAALLVGLPGGVPRQFVSTAFFWGDSELEHWAINPGTELACLGYPFGVEANAEGFPILRSGKIASYPLLPTIATKGFLFDFRVFRGNSGGPVYVDLRNPSIDGNTTFVTVQGIVGLVTEERSITQRIEGLYERKESDTPLSLGYVVHARFIRDVVEALPSP